MHADGPIPSNMIFGVHPVREALLSEQNRVEKVIISQGRRDTRIGEIIRLARERGIPINHLSSPLFRKVFSVKGVQSVAAQVATVAFKEADALMSPEASLLLVIDEVTDPRNLGSIFRSAAAAGVNGVFLPTRRVAPLSATVEKASSGAVNLVQTARVVNIVRLVRSLNERSIQTVALVPSAPICYLDCDYTQPTALVVGGEEKGIRPLLKETCSVCVSIPMAGVLQSLNVSVATAVVLYEALRQRRARELQVHSRPPSQ